MMRKKKPLAADLIPAAGSLSSIYAHHKERKVSVAKQVVDEVGDREKPEPQHDVHVLPPDGAHHPAEGSMGTRVERRDERGQHIPQQIAAIWSSELASLWCGKSIF